MKITFTTLTTSKDEIEIKADNYKSTYYKTESVKTDGAELDPHVFTDLSSIKIGTSKTKPSFTDANVASLAELVKYRDYTKVAYENLTSYLSAKTANTTDTPYKIWINTSPETLAGVSSTSSAQEGTLQYALLKNDTKYVDLLLPDFITSISEYAFYGCTSLTSVTVPDSVTSISKNAFYGCTSLTSVTISDSVTSIGSSAFDSCTSLKSVTIPNSVTTISNSLFYGCSSLASVTISDSVTFIGDYAFYECASLSTVTYLGTIEQFKAINGYINVTQYCNVTCSDGTIAKSS